MSARAKPKLIVIVGPNASGKSALAVKLAKRFNGEIISADSRQVYRGLTIATGKISKREMRSVTHHLLDVADPRYQFSIAEFKPLAEQAIHEIVVRGTTPILVGGTGFWVDAVVYNRTFPEVPPNHRLRRKLGRKNSTELLRILKKLDPRRARTIEEKNPRRLIRAIEIARTLGWVPKLKQSSPYDVLWIGMKLPRDMHTRRIRMRLRDRMKAGMIREVRKLRRHGMPWKRFDELGLEYRLLASYLRGKISKVELLMKIERNDKDYARRQMVWFKKNPNIHWISNAAPARKLVTAFLKNH